MKLLRYISLCILLLFSGGGYSQSLLQSVPLVRYDLTFDGVDEYMNIDNTLINALSITTRGSWSIWVKPNGTPTVNEYFISFGDTDVNTHLEIFITSGSKVRAFLRDAIGSRWSVSTDNATLFANTWTHIVLTHDAIVARLYINKIFVAQTLSGSSQSEWFLSHSGIDNGRISALNANNNGDQQQFFGMVDEVSFWDINLSLSEIAEIYNNNKPTNLKGHSKVANLVAWYQMGEFSSYDGTNWNIIDASVNNNTGVTVNMEESDRGVTSLIYEQPIGIFKSGTNLVTAP